MNYKIKVLLSMPKSLWVNLHYFAFKDAVKLPLLIAYNTRIGELSKNAQIRLECPLEKGIMRFGFHSIDSMAGKEKQYFTLQDNGVLVLKGKADFAEGVAFTINGEVIIGSHVIANNNFRLSSHKRVEIGDDVLIGWNVTMLDSDNHTIYYPDEKKNAEAPIVIGNHVWIGAFANFLKGSSIPDNCVVSYRSLVTRKFTKSNYIIAGAPAKEIKEIVTWEK